MGWSWPGQLHPEVFVPYRDARLTVHGRRILAERVLAGRPVAHVAAERAISRPTAHKWVRRRRAEGEGHVAAASARMSQAITHVTGKIAK